MVGITVTPLYLLQGTHQAPGIMPPATAPGALLEDFEFGHERNDLFLDPLRISPESLLKSLIHDVRRTPKGIQQPSHKLAQFSVLVVRLSKVLILRSVDYLDAMIPQQANQPGRRILAKFFSTALRSELDAINLAVDEPDVVKERFFVETQLS